MHSTTETKGNPSYTTSIMVNEKYAQRKKRLINISGMNEKSYIAILGWPG